MEQSPINCNLFVKSLDKTTKNIRCDCKQENAVRVEKGMIDNFTLRNIEIYYPETDTISSDDVDSRHTACPFYINGASRVTLDNIRVLGIKNVSDCDIIKSNCPDLVKKDCNF